MRARMCVIHWHCTAQLSMFNMEKRYRNKIIIIIIIIIIIDHMGSEIFFFCLLLCLHIILTVSVIIGWFAKCIHVYERSPLCL